MARATRGGIAFAFVLACGAMSSCDGTMMIVTGMDGGVIPHDYGPVLMEAPVDSKVAYEGYQRFVTTVTAEGHDLTAARIRVVDSTGPLEILEQVCNVNRCALHLRIHDTMSELAAPDPVPAPAALVNEFLDVRPADGAILQATIAVYPAHTVGAHGDGSIHDPMLISGGAVDTGTTLRGAPVGGPPRWYVMGDSLSVSGSMDVSPRTDTGGTTMPVAVTGGAAGGGAGLRAAGASGGDLGATGAGGGGGGHSVVGAAGQGADGTAGTGGVGGPASGQSDLPCLINPTSTGCGGGGGGGASGPGGPGGGGLLIVSLEPLDFSLGSLLARGADGMDGGGGGAGGAIFIAAPAWMAPATISVDGGHGAPHAGGGRGGDGAVGRLRIDVPGVSVPGAWSGPMVDTTSVPLITAMPDLPLTGTATAGVAVHVERTTDLLVMTTTAAADGTFALSFPLVPGTNRLRVTEDSAHGIVHNWIGNSFEFGADTCITHSDCVPKGALVDVAYVPATE